MKFLTMFSVTRLSVAATLGLVLAAPAVAQSDTKGFDPREDCSAIFARNDTLEQVVMSAWSLGYLAANAGDTQPVTMDMVRAKMRGAAMACARNGSQSVLDMIAADSPASGGTASQQGDAAAPKAQTAQQEAQPAQPAQTAPAAPVDQPGSRMAVIALLQKFVTPGNDILAMSKAIYPTEADIRAVYRDPLASQLVKNLLPLFASDVAFKPKPDQDAIYLVYSTTDKLIAGSTQLQAFPGGYKKVLQYMNPGFPIVRFKFVKKGEMTGLAFDGLVFVNDRWVLIPKPWKFAN